MWGRLRELNPRPILYEGIALPTELRRREPPQAEQVSSLVACLFALRVTTATHRHKHNDKS